MQRKLTAAALTAAGSLLLTSPARSEVCDIMRGTRMLSDGTTVTVTIQEPANCAAKVSGNPLFRVWMRAMMSAEQQFIAMDQANRRVFSVVPFRRFDDTFAAFKKSNECSRDSLDYPCDRDARAFVLPQSK
jgi:hypothetical protein